MVAQIGCIASFFLPQGSSGYNCSPPLSMKIINNDGSVGPIKAFRTNKTQATGIIIIITTQQADKF